MHALLRLALVASFVTALPPASAIDQCKIRGGFVLESEPASLVDVVRDHRASAPQCFGDFVGPIVFADKGGCGPTCRWAWLGTPEFEPAASLAVRCC
ncbi:MAG: hypothetical protein ACT4PT_04955 [Methanobacteriota archaeon]